MKYLVDSFICSKIHFRAATFIQYPGDQTNYGVLLKHSNKTYTGLIAKFAFTMLWKYNVVGFSRYLNSANAWFSVFHDFIFTNGAHMSYNVNSILQFWSLFRGLKFHESTKSAKFAEFKYLKKPTIWQPIHHCFQLPKFCAMQYYSFRH